MFKICVQVVFATLAVIVVAQNEGERDGKGMVFGKF